MADYPSAIFTPRTTENLPGISYDADDTTTGYAEDYSLPAAEIVAIEETLGINPQGAYSTVAERLDAIVPTKQKTQRGLIKISQYKVNIAAEGVINGENTVFTVPEEIEEGTLAVYKDRLRSIEQTDYNYQEGSRRLVFNEAPQTAVYLDYIAEE